jgi:hypothetical protein
MIERIKSVGKRELMQEARIAMRTIDAACGGREISDEDLKRMALLAGLREGKRIAAASLVKPFRAAEALGKEADPVAAAMDNALNDLRRLKEKVGGPE